ncbi:sulfotransferase family protein [Roseimarinus sediminis]|uniref:sulfotransferase family protein n=1 Tax=Roseimarinus sediminis TaxID=1610899 RepID=UPI003D1E62F4
MKHPIFILGAHKSGTSLLRSLFDSHSQLFTIPFEAHYFELSQHWVENPYRKTSPQPRKAATTRKAMIEYMQLLNQSDDRYADSVMKDRIDTARFEAQLQINDQLPEEQWIENYFAAIARSLGHEAGIDRLRVVEKSVENGEFAIELSRLFPSAKFIHIVRNPYSNIVALRKYKSIGFGFPLIDKLFNTLSNNFYWLEKNQKNIENYLLVRYEDLLTNPKNTLDQICNFLDLNFEETLLVPTSQGVQWKGNSTSNKQFSGIDASNLDKWKKELLPIEAAFINRHLAFIVEKYGYEKYECEGSEWKRGKGESLKRYFYNRLYRYYLH